MKLLVNDKEISRFLIDLLDIKASCKLIQIKEVHQSEAVAYTIEAKKKSKFNLKKRREKIRQKITQGVRKDLKAWQDEIKEHLRIYRSYYFKNINSNVDYFIKKLGEDRIFDLYKKHPKKNFIKTVGLQIDSKGEMVRRSTFIDQNEYCLLRNTVGNENLLINKIDNQQPFWFIDSGYTNFTEPNKKWHRLVKNHLHFNRYFDAPPDRLSGLASFPRPWRSSGGRVLIIEPGPFAAAIFHINIEQWKIDVVNEIKKYTDRPIEFRPKIDKKKRMSLYDHLMREDYYCTVSINSNSAVESIWAGVPAITLGKHISNPVTVSRLDMVNDLYRGPLGNWLSWLTYCQFTFDELMDGTAVEIIRKYHE